MNSYSDGSKYDEENRNGYCSSRNNRVREGELCAREINNTN